MPKIRYGRIAERDMDLLFCEAIASDIGFVEMFLEKTGMEYHKITVEQIELSHTEADLGESDITVKINVDGILYGLLIEDKIDAIAMEKQHERYIKRGNKGIEAGEYDAFYVFIICPEKYYRNNAEAKRYENHISYEECYEYFQVKNDVISQIRGQQMKQAIAKGKRPSQTILNEKANAFFLKYKAYQEENYPELDLRTKENSNGYWTYYATKFGSQIYIYHKILQGYVDLTFTSAAKEMERLEQAVLWLREHGFQEVKAVKTGRAGALRIQVPKLDLYSEFPENGNEEIDKCFEVIGKFTKMINFCETILKLNITK